MIIPYAPATATAGQKFAATETELIKVAREQGPDEAARLAWGPGSRITFEQCAEIWRKAAGLPPAEQAA